MTSIADWIHAPRSTWGTRSVQVPVPDPSAASLAVLVTRLRESHEISVCEAVERMVQAGKSVGLDTHALVRMLDRGMTFKALLELIQSRMETWQKAA